MKRILCLIESIGPSGAERQIASLAVWLKRAGHEVEVAYYVRKEFFLPFLEENGVAGRYLSEAAPACRRFFAIRRHVREFRPDTVISYSVSPGMVTCLLKLLGAKFRLVVSERNTTQCMDLRERLKFFLYRWSDHIVPNSQSQGRFIAGHFPKLAPKVKVVTNFIDTESFFPAPARKSAPEGCRMIGVGRLAPQKNVLAFIGVVSLLKDKGLHFHVDWYGQDFKDEYARECHALVREKALGDVLSFHPQTADIVRKYQEADLFCLPSLYEGFPNVLCEAMCCGLPVVCSRVSDVPQIMEDGGNGFLFNPLDVSDMAGKLEKMMALPEEERERMSVRSREMAVEKFSSDAFVHSYLELI